MTRLDPTCSLPQNSHLILSPLFKLAFVFCRMQYTKTTQADKEKLRGKGRGEVWIEQVNR